jgi:hypothetical protein
MVGVHLRHFFQGIHLLKELADFLRSLRPLRHPVAEFLLVPQCQSMSI